MADTISPMTRALPALALLLIACSSAHTADDAGAPTLSDADTSRTTDASRPTSCTLDVGDVVGEPCFCHGPAAVLGDVLYRQSLGVEIWDVADPLAPRAAGHIDEPPASQGGLMIARGHLVSVRNLESTLSVYRLDDPFAPTLRATLPLGVGDVTHLAGSDELAVVGTTGADGSPTLVGIDLRDLDTPTILWRAPLEGRVANSTVDGLRVFALTQTVFGEDAWLDEVDARSGELVGHHRIGEGPGASGWFAGLATHRDRVLVGAPGAVRILEVGASVVEVARFVVEEGAVGALAVHGDLAFVGGMALRVLDLSDPLAPRELARTEVPIGDLAHIPSSGEGLFVSNGGGLLPVQLTCE